MKLYNYVLIAAMLLSTGIHTIDEIPKKDPVKNYATIAVATVFTAGIVYFAVRKVPLYWYSNISKSKKSIEKDSSPLPPELQQVSQDIFAMQIKKAYDYYLGERVTNPQEQATIGRLLALLEKQQDQLGTQKVDEIFASVSRLYRKARMDSLEELITNIKAAYTSDQLNGQETTIVGTPQLQSKNDELNQMVCKAYHYASNKGTFEFKDIESVLQILNTLQLYNNSNYAHVQGVIEMLYTKYQNKIIFDQSLYQLRV